MSELDKARAAMEAIRALDLDNVPLDANGLIPLQTMEQFNRLLSIVKVQAEIAQADALNRIAIQLDKLDKLDWVLEEIREFRGDFYRTTRGR